MPYDYAVFISYSSEDRPWAQRLFDDLKTAGIPENQIFFDVERLEKGHPWEPQLAKSLLKAQHLVALWTVAGSASAWMWEETVRFKAEIDPQGTGPLNAERRLFPIIMGAELSSTLTRYHSFTSVKNVNVAAGPAAMAPGEQKAWAAIVYDIVETLRPPRKERPWPVAVLAATNDALTRTPAVPPDGTLEGFLPLVSVSKPADFHNKYGARPEDWKPFGSTRPISQILDDLLQGVNSHLQAVHSGTPLLRWQYVDLITTPIGRVDDEVQKLSIGPCLLVIDSLSMLVPHVAQRYSHLQPCFDNPHALIQWLTPFGTHEPIVSLRRLVKEAAQPFIRGYYEPIPPKAPRGRCALGVADDGEMSRLFLSSLADQASLAESAAVSSVLSVERRS